MYRAPSRRSNRKPDQRLNLIPILDSVFIFIFFLLMSASFLKIYEIQSDVPILSAGKPPKNKKKPLALTVKIHPSSIEIYTGVPASLVKSFSKLPSGDYDLESMHSLLIGIKKSNMQEKSAIFEPKADINYEELTKIMDAVRMLRKTDPALYYKDKDGLDVKVESLFNNIVFGNIQS